MRQQIQKNFLNLLDNQDQILIPKKRKISLFLTILWHIIIQTIYKIYQTEFLSLNSTLVFQSIEMVIKFLRALYSEELVNYILEAIDEILSTSSSTARQVSYKISFLQEIQFVDDNLSAIKTIRMQNCFTNSSIKSLDLCEILSNRKLMIFCQFLLTMKNFEKQTTIYYVTIIMKIVRV